MKCKTKLARWTKAAAAASDNNNSTENSGESENSMTRKWRENQFFHDAVMERDPGKIDPLKLFTYQVWHE